MKTPPFDVIRLPATRMRPARWAVRDRALDIPIVTKPTKAAAERLAGLLNRAETRMRR